MVKDGGPSEKGQSFTCYLTGEYKDKMNELRRANDGKIAPAFRQILKHAVRNEEYRIVSFVVTKEEHAKLKAKADEAQDTVPGIVQEAITSALR